MNLFTKWNCKIYALSFHINSMVWEILVSLYRFVDNSIKINKINCQIFQPHDFQHVRKKNTKPLKKKNKKNWDFDKKLLLISSESTSTLKTTQNVHILRDLGVAYWESFRLLSCSMRTLSWSRSRRSFPLMCVNCCCCILWKDFF